MSNLGLLNVPNWVTFMCIIAVPVLIVLCFYFTLNFFESLHKDNERGIDQNKVVATICLFFAFFLVPFIYSIVLIFSKR